VLKTLRQKQREVCTLGSSAPFGITFRFRQNLIPKKSVQNGITFRESRKVIPNGGRLRWQVSPHSRGSPPRAGYSRVSRPATRWGRLGGEGLRHRSGDLPILRTGLEPRAIWAQYRLPTVAIEHIASPLKPILVAKNQQKATPDSAASLTCQRQLLPPKQALRHQQRQRRRVARRVWPLARPRYRPPTHRVSG
jgi:hypothetical protein